MSKQDAIAALNVIPSIKGGNKAIKQFQKQLTPIERKKMNKFINTLLSPLDLLNSALESAVKVLYLLP